MSRRKPTITPEQFREASKLLRVEVSNIAWSLVVSPAPITEIRRWRSLTPDESMDVFDRLMRAVSRHSITDGVRIAEPQAVAEEPR